MKTCTKIVLLLLIPAFSFAQKSQLDSLHTSFRSARTDSARFSSLSDLTRYYMESKLDSSFYYNTQALALAIKNNKAMEEAQTLDARGYLLMNLYRYPESLQAFQRALKLAEDSENENKNATWNTDFSGLKNPVRHTFRVMILVSIHHDFGHLLGSVGNIDQQIEQYRLTRQLATEVNDKGALGFVNMNLGAVYLKLNRLDSALLLEHNAERIMQQLAYKSYIGGIYNIIGEIYLKKGNTALALQTFHKAITVSTEQKNASEAVVGYSDLTNYYFSKKQTDSSLYYAKKRARNIKIHGRKAPGRGL